MTGNEYQEQAKRFINYDLTPEGLIMNASLGLSGETGEFNELIKKWFFHGHDLELEHAAKELGDIAWYLALACTTLGINLDDVLQTNIEKLSARYPEGFKSEDSINRAENDI